MRFLVDENLPAEVADLLLTSGHDVVYVPRTDLHRSPDERLNEFAVRENRIIVIRDLDFPLQGVESAPGLVLIRVPSESGRLAITETVRDFLNDPSFGDVLGRITVVAPGHVRSRPLVDA